jgi:hypothetical protein
MKEFKELENAQYFMNMIYEKFEQMTNREIKEDICQALFMINHFILLNKPIKQKVSWDMKACMDQLLLYSEANTIIGNSERAEGFKLAVKFLEKSYIHDTQPTIEPDAKKHPIHDCDWIYTNNDTFRKCRICDLEMEVTFRKKNFGLTRD